VPTITSVIPPRVVEGGRVALTGSELSTEIVPSVVVGNEPARTWFTAMMPIANNWGDVVLPPVDPRYVDGGPNSKVPSIAGMTVDQARQRLRDSGFQVADQPTAINSSSPAGTVVGSSPSGQTIPGVIVTIQTSNGIPPAPPPPPPFPDGLPPPEWGQTVVEIPGLPPITVPVLLPPAPAPPPPP